MLLSRRKLMLGTAGAMGSVLFSKTSHAQSQFHGLQFHNQQADSPLHRSLVALWAAVKRESNNQFIVETFPLNNRTTVTDPQALNMVISGDLEFYTAGIILDDVIPAAASMVLPFVFSNSEQAFDTIDGDLGSYLRQEMGTKGIHAFSRGCFDHGFHHITNRSQPIQTAQDMVGLKLRVPPSPIVIDFFKTLRAETQVTRVIDTYDAIKSGKVDAQENPLIVIETFKLYEVQKYISLTNLMWSGFQLISNLKFWNKVPTDIQDIIQRNVIKYVIQQRQEQKTLNLAWAKQLKQQGLIFNEIDVQSFRNELGSFYPRWQKQIGSTAWNILESDVGKIK
jgi:tripartite ATP-independent transporter DctP family solute receptor